MDTQKIKESLLKIDSRIKPEILDKIMPKIDSLDPELRASLEHWLLTGEEPTIQIEGYSVSSLKKSHKQTVFAAIMTLDYLKREPEKAKKSLNLKYDRIIRPH
jgi:hypothetical protein